MKKTMLILMCLVVTLTISGCGKDQSEVTAKQTFGINGEADSGNSKSIAGVYTLVSVDGANVPASVSHGGHDVMVYSGVFTINADKTCVSDTVFGSQDNTRQVKATYTQNGSELKMKWIGAGRTTGTVEGDTFEMNNEGMIFSYKKQPATIP